MRLLLEIHQYWKPNDSSISIPDLSKLNPLFKQIDDVLETVTNNENDRTSSSALLSYQNSSLQSMVELMACTELIKKQLSSNTKKQDDTEKKIEGEGKEEKNNNNTSSSSNNNNTPSDKNESSPIDLSSLCTYRMRIIRAIYGSGITGYPSTSTPLGPYQLDITNELSSYLQSCGGTQLYLPANQSLLQRIPAFAIDPSSASKKEKKLFIRYDIIRLLFNPSTGLIEEQIIKTIDKSLTIPFGRGHGILIKPDPSSFDRVVELSRLTLAMKNDGKTLLPIDLQLSAIRSDAIHQSYYPLLEEKLFSPTDRIGISDIGSTVSSFTIHLSLQSDDSITKTSASLTTTGAASASSDSSSPALLRSTSGKKPPTTPGTKSDGPIRVLLYKGNQNIEIQSAYIQGRTVPYTIGTGWLLGINNDNKIIFNLYSPNAPLVSITSLKSLSSKDYYHISVSVSRQYIRLFINGIEESHKKIHPQRRYTSDPFFIGRLPFGIDEYDNTASNSNTNTNEERIGFSGTLKHVRFYTKELTASQLISIIKGKENNSNNNNNEWGLFISSESLRRTLLHSPSFTPSMDAQLVELFSYLLEQENNKRLKQQQSQQYPHQLHSSNNNDLLTLMDIQPYSIDIDNKILSSYPLISHLSIDSLRSRISLLIRFNRQLSSVLSFVDFSQVNAKWSLAHRLSTMSAIIFKDVKLSVFQSILRQTSSGSGGMVQISINRPRAIRAREKGDMTGLKSVFGQMYRQLHFIKPAQLRSHDRPWRVEFVGEGAIDAGGPFRESISNICSELQSPALPLLIPSPNNRSSSFENQDSWIINPSSTSSLHLSMLAFLGKLFGMAMRANFVLNLDLPSIIFKGIIGAPITSSDINAIDSHALKPIDLIKNLQRSINNNNNNNNLSIEEFNEKLNDLSFITMSADGREIELKENGKSILVTKDNCDEYCELLEQYHINQFSSHIKAIRRGMATIVPIHLISLFTVQEIELLICGRREISIPQLQANTIYRSPFHSSHPVVLWLWEILESFSHLDRSKFFRFVTGSSRLPTGEWSQKFDITPSRINNDTILPVSHTCFNSIELPLYSNKEVLRQKLLYAITNCVAIDTDQNTRDNVDWNSDD